MTFGSWIHLYNNEKRFLKKESKKQILVACILGFYKGKRFIKEQIQSIIDQNNKNLSISLFISDDNTGEKFPNLHDLNLKGLENIDIFYRKSSKNYGYSYNFISALNSINSNFDYFCFSDQDDIWHKEKIMHSINSIKVFKNNEPSLYFGRTNYFNEDCSKKIGESIFFKKKASFKNAIVQNIAAGNTMLFNKASKDIITSFKIQKVVSHDWWCYQIITGVGGHIFYDSKPCLKYRQHQLNILGSNNRIKDKKIRLKKLFNGDVKKWNDMNLYALNKNRSLLTKENRRILDNFCLARKSSLFKRLFLFYKTGIFRQNRISNISLIIALFFRKI